MADYLATIYFNPLLPVLLIAVAAGLAIACAAWLSLTGERRLVLFGLRFVAIGTLVWALLNPVKQVPAPSGGEERPRVVVLVDISASMAQRDAGRDEDTERLTYAQQTWLSDASLARLRAVADVQLRTFDRGLSGSFSGQKPDGRATHLFDALSRTDADISVVVSDGHDTTGQGVSRKSGSSQLVFAVPVGSSRSAPDLAVQAWAKSDRLFEGQSTQIRAQLYQRGLGDQQASVRLLKDGKVIQRVSRTLSQSLTDITFDITPELGANQPSTLHQYQVVAGLDTVDEATTENNREHVFVQVSRDRVRVLIIEGMPHWETRGLSRVLSQSPRFEVEGRYALGEQRRVNVLPGDGDGSVARDSEQPFAGFDVIVLGRGVERLMSQDDAKALTRFVQDEGGAVVFSRGRPTGDGQQGTAILAAFSPITPVDFGKEESRLNKLIEPKGSATGEQGILANFGGEGIWTKLPGMVALTQVDGRRAASVVQLEIEDNGAAGAGESAAVVTLRSGRGASLAILTDGLWRWELAGGQPGETAYAAFWTRAVQWLATGGAFLPGQDIGLELSGTHIEPGQSIQATVSTRFVDTSDFQPLIHLVSPDGNRQELNVAEPSGSGRFSYQVAPGEQGVYQVELSTPAKPDLVSPDHPIVRKFVVVDRAVEFRDTTARPDVLKALVQPTGGQCLEVDQVEPVMDAIQKIALARSSDARREPVFDSPILMAILGGSLGLHWLIRRRGGLL